MALPLKAECLDDEFGYEKFETWKKAYKTLQILTSLLVSKYSNGFFGFTGLTPVLTPSPRILSIRTWVCGRSIVLLYHLHRFNFCSSAERDISLSNY